ncbi:MAG: hypothetical protein BV459_05570 [Thermoplasmata archaeon M11B2D]|nr:MAG: hypothetical protein BV459_05570 [Thermoplasmata archaeon M11B2D]PNX52743.1 MAG: hypothetical protein BV458_08090 [Thermoplasmata archaeon M9B2D]
MIIGFLVIGTLLLGGCVQQPVTRSYSNSEYGFSLNPPVEWQQVESNLSTVAVWFSPKNSSNVSLIISVPFSLGEGQMLNTFADQVEEGLSESGVNHSILHRGWRSISRMQAYEIEYLYEREGVMEFVKQVEVLKTQSVFLITFFAPALVYEKYLSEVDESIDSFL